MPGSLAVVGPFVAVATDLQTAAATDGALCCPSGGLFRLPSHAASSGHQAATRLQWQACLESIQLLRRKMEPESVTVQKGSLTLPQYFLWYEASDRIF